MTGKSNNRRKSPLTGAQKSRAKRERWKLRETFALALVETGRLLPGDDECEVCAQRRRKIDAACDGVLRDWANAVLTSTVGGGAADPLRVYPGAERDTSGSVGTRRTSATSGACNSEARIKSPANR